MFVPLQIKSSYSLLQSTIQPRELVKTAKERGYQAIAITDEQVMYGVIEFYQAAQQYGIKPLIGLEMTVLFGQLATQQVKLLFYAQSYQGYQSLMQLSTLRMTKQNDLTWQDVQTHLTDVIVIVAPQLMAIDAVQIALLQSIRQVVTDRLYMGINLNLDPIRRQVIIDLAQQIRTPVVACEAVEYLESNQYFASQVLRSIGTKHVIEDPLNGVQHLGTHELKPMVDVEQAYQAAGLADAARKTERVARRCQLELNFQAPILPQFPTPNQEDAYTYLKTLCQQGLQNRPIAKGHAVSEYQARLDHELSVIHDMGFDNYFLIIWDVMAFAHQHQITTGPGRGSAAGSLVAYALAITDVDPIQYQLLFERFLNPERQQMPDIDLDLPDNRREEVLTYVHQKYGHQRVAQIITLGTLAARQAVNSVGQVLGVPKYQLAEVQQVVRRQTPTNQKYTLKQVVQASQALQNMMQDDPLIKLLIEVAEDLEGLPRNVSTHAAGLVLSEDPLIDTVPLQNGSSEAGLLMTQYPKDPVETLGLLKMDFLGLRNLSIMDEAMRLIHQTNPDFSLNQVNLTDPLTMKLFQTGETDGVFQFESNGIRRVLQQLQPDSFEDIVAVNALYRPGPMNNIDHFIARKHGQEATNYITPALEPILKNTYGILVYQEQVMQVAVAMAGFSLGQADSLRRAMSKKKAQEMERMRHSFVQGALQKGYEESVAQQVFDYMDQFANYGFNRSHAVAYSKMAFEMAYLKAHYPLAFYAALLSIEPNPEKEIEHFQSAKRMQVAIKNPSINQSDSDFTVENNRLRIGLGFIKGIRGDFVKAILTERQARGPFENLNDFINRLDERWQNEKQILPLIYVGAFDRLGYNRAEMVQALPGLIEGASKFQTLSLSDELAPVIERRPELNINERLAKESEYLGLYISGHPVNQYAKLQARLQSQVISHLKADQIVTLIVQINRVRVVKTKRDRREMAFLTVSDETGNLDVTVFPSQYLQFKTNLQNNQIVVINGKVEQRNQELQLIANRIALAQQVQAETTPKRWVLRITPGVSEQQIINLLNQLQREASGNYPVIFYDAVTNQAQQSRYHLDGENKVIDHLKELLGNENVILQEMG
ncbi:DNA-directed DNA polymerase III alpha subunit [Limosilactobacillus gastricus PS3]|uniref:DNA polymerase III subunit alpha n=1 Tax=Limosilactobacillus gastricus PS3 TaxID=1144300 RepID=H4GHV0_9LACO|nr:DNA polymerase III subunit alpha [Limosilactobacillus gastricus]EHS87506.1 DNA-directed DNA polymerase III alpha subunit [Limosilactobacillus gastricus PS3]